MLKYSLICNIWCSITRYVPYKYSHFQILKYQSLQCIYHAICSWLEHLRSICCRMDEMKPTNDYLTQRFEDLEAEVKQLNKELYEVNTGSTNFQIWVTAWGQKKRKNKSACKIGFQGKRSRHGLIIYTPGRVQAVWNIHIHILDRKQIYLYCTLCANQQNQKQKSSSLSNINVCRLSVKSGRIFQTIFRIVLFRLIFHRPYKSYLLEYYVLCYRSVSIQAVLCKTCWKRIKLILYPSLLILKTY